MVHDLTGYQQRELEGMHTKVKVPPAENLLGAGRFNGWLPLGARHGRATGCPRLGQRPGVVSRPSPAPGARCAQALGRRRRWELLAAGAPSGYGGTQVQVLGPPGLRDLATDSLCGKKEERRWPGRPTAVAQECVPGSDTEALSSSVILVKSLRVSGP